MSPPGESPSNLVHDVAPVPANEFDPNAPALGEQQYLLHDQAPSSPMEPGGKYGPYAAWPLTHPKICGGILLAERQDGEAKLTAEQARKALPLLHALGAAWQEAIGNEAAIREVLTPRQRRFVFDNKSRLEDPRFIQTTFPKGNHLQACHDLLESRAAESPRAAGDPVDEAAEPIGIITFSDMLTGIYVMESEQGLAITPDQATQLIPLYEKMDLGEVKRCERELSELLTPDQVTLIQDNIDEITQLKKDVFDGTHDGGFYGDPLIWMTIELADARLDL